MPWKTNEDGSAIAMADGNPVWIGDDGTEVAADYPRLTAAITSRNAEAKASRIRAEKAEAELKAFEGIDDVEAARRALATVAGLDEAKQKDAAKADEARRAAIDAARKPIETERDDARRERDALKGQLNGAVIGGAIARSDYITKNLTRSSAEMIDMIGRRLSVEDGQLRAADLDGNVIYSRLNPGDPATGDEAIELAIAVDPRRDTWLKGPNPGLGVRPGGQGHPRKKWAELSGTEKVELHRSNPQEYDRLKAAG